MVWSTVGYNILEEDISSLFLSYYFIEERIEIHSSKRSDINRLVHYLGATKISRFNDFYYEIISKLNFSPNKIYVYDNMKDLKIH